MDLRSIIREAIEEFDRKAYLAWKRKNVSYRGVNEESPTEDGFNGGGARFGSGLYTAALSNKSMSRQYGTVYFVVNAVPKNPMVFGDTNQCEVWLQNNVYARFSKGGFPDRQAFHKNTTIEAEMLKMGYDGIVIKGREMVNYAPPADVRYFRDEGQVRSYWRMNVQNAGVMNERIAKVDLNEYAKRVADAYMAAPMKESGVEGHWAALNQSNHKLFKQIQSKVRVEFVDEDPYSTADEMRRDVKESKVMKIYRGHSSHPYFSEEDNCIFRAVHDWYTHIIHGEGFDLRGELRAYNTHSKLAPAAALPALFTEVVGQVCCTIVNGGFPPQKMIIMKGFDYKVVGSIFEPDDRAPL